MRKIKTSLILGLAVIFFGLTIKVFGIPGSISMDEFANANEPEQSKNCRKSFGFYGKNRHVHA